MQEDFLTSPINRQTGCKQYISNVTGGPASTILPVCSVFVCNDDCTTGNLTYSINPLEDYYGKRTVIIKSVDTTATGFKIRLTLPLGETFVSTGTDTYDLPDTPSTTEIDFPIGAGVPIGVFSYDSTSGSAVNIYTSDGQINIVGPGTRTVDLNGNRLLFSDTGVGGALDVNVDAMQIIVPDISIQGSLIEWNAPSQDNTINQILVHHPVSNEIHWRDAATIGSNIYNADGSLTSNRTLTLNNRNLTTTGTGNVSVTNTGIVSVTPTSSTTIGTLNQTTTLPGIVVMPNLPSFFGGFLTYNTGTKQVGYLASGSVDDSIFSVGLGSFSTTKTGTNDFPALSGSSFATNQPINHSGWNNAANFGTLDLATGDFTPSSTINCDVLATVVVRNTTEVPKLDLELNWLGVVVSKAQFNSGVINQYNTYSLVDRCRLSAGRPYNFRVNLRNTGGTQYDFDTCVFSINLT